METKRLEHILIIILALLNGFLLVVVLADRAQAAGSRRDTVAMLTALLEDGGIEVGRDAELLQTAPARCTVVRDLELERRRVSALLNDTVNAEDLGGSIWFYSTGSGQLRMRGTGEIDILFTGSDGVRRRGRSPLSAARELMDRCGIDLYDIRLPEDRGSPSYCCCWYGLPVFNAALRFDFSGDRLYMASGAIFFNTETDRDQSPGMDSVSVLVRFMDLVKNDGFICSRLDSLTPGYTMSVAMSGESVLTPVWRIVTDTGELYINALTGQRENI